MSLPLGRLEPVPVRQHWPKEDRDFTPWLCQPENLQLLSDTIDVPLTLESTERFVGPYRADIVCLEGGSGDSERRAVIENQFGRSDHDHLGKLLTYMSGTDGYTGIWITETFTDEHRAALEWLNEHSDTSKSFWGLEIELWRIGNSPPAPRFNVVVEPNPITKLQHEESSSLSETKLQRLSFWQGFHEYLGAEQANVKVGKAVPETWISNTVGRSGIYFGLSYTNYDLEAQKYTDGIVTRIELVLSGPSASHYYAQLLADQATIDPELGTPLPVWYDTAPKERKIFVQQLWPSGDEGRDLQYAWLLEHLQRMRGVLLPRIQRLTPPPPTS